MRVAVILLSYGRGWNMQRLVDASLDARFVSDVIVSNNNPSERIANWVKRPCARLRLIDQRKRCGCSKRFELARMESHHAFVCFDDDVLLTASQVDALVEALSADLDVPHGLYGSDHLFSDSGLVWHALHRTRGEYDVDVLHGVYAFTRHHVETFYRNMALARRHGLGRLAIADDILLSVGSGRRPRIHDLGPVKTDPSWNDGSIAVHTNKRNVIARQRLIEFFARRSMLGAPGGG